MTTVYILQYSSYVTTLGVFGMVICIGYDNMFDMFRKYVATHQKALELYGLLL